MLTLEGMLGDQGGVIPGVAGMSLGHLRVHFRGVYGRERAVVGFATREMMPELLSIACHVSTQSRLRVRNETKMCARADDVAGTRNSLARSLAASPVAAAAAAAAAVQLRPTLGTCKG